MAWKQTCVILKNTVNKKSKQGKCPTPQQQGRYATKRKKERKKERKKDRKKVKINVIIEIMLKFYKMKKKREEKEKRKTEKEKKESKNNKKECWTFLKKEKDRKKWT